MSRCSTATVNVRYVGPLREHKHADGSPCIDSSVNNVLLQTNPDFNQSLLEFIHILERRLIDPLLHDPPELVIDQVEVGAVGGHRPGEIKSGGLRSNSSIILRADALVHCPAETRTCDQRHV